MRPKYKMTGCARFFIFLIIFIPAVYFGAAFFRGEDGVQIIKDFWHKTFSPSETTSSSPEQSDDTYQIKNLEEELKKAKDEIRDLKATIYEKDREIEKLKSGGE
jgi:predicted RNase H-like nuclease (RuvC/YqgF family)